MKIFVVYWHPEPQSFNAALLETICTTLGSLGHEVKTSDLYRMNFDPVSSRRNFNTMKEPRYFKQQAVDLTAISLAFYGRFIGACCSSSGLMYCRRTSCTHQRG